MHDLIGLYGLVSLPECSVPQERSDDPNHDSNSPLECSAFRAAAAAVVVVVAVVDALTLHIDY